MTPELAAVARARAFETAREQGLPEMVADDGALRRLAALLAGAAGRANPVPIREARPPGNDDAAPGRAARRRPSAKHSTTTDACEAAAS